MKSEFRNLSSKELIELYSKIKDFNNYLEKEFKNAEKLRDANE